MKMIVRMTRRWTEPGDVNHSPVDSAERCGSGRAQRDPALNDLALATVSDNVSQARQWRALGDEKKTRSRPRVGDPTPGLRKDVFERSHACDKTNIAKRKMVVEERGEGGPTHFCHETKRSSARTRGMSRRTAHKWVFVRMNRKTTCALLLRFQQILQRFRNEQCVKYFESWVVLDFAKKEFSKIV
jgi:hypothetical protein